VATKLATPLDLSPKATARRTMNQFLSSAKARIPAQRNRPVAVRGHLPLCLPRSPRQVKKMTRGMGTD
jgi:hypothetical protein